MAKLVVTLADLIQGHYFLDKDRFTIGRKPDNDIFLDDPGVSKLHAVIVTIGNDQVVEDSGSANGVLVNGDKVTKHILQNSDVISIGNFQLKYINQRASSGMDFDKTLVMASSSWQIDELAENAVPVIKPQLDTAISSARLVKTDFPLGGVKGVKGEYAGQELVISLPLKTFGEATVGLAMIARRPHGYFLTHVAGNKATRLNGKSTGVKSHLLHEHDLIEVAGQKLRFFIQK